MKRPGVFEQLQRYNKQHRFQGPQIKRKDRQQHTRATDWYKIKAPLYIQYRCFVFYAHTSAHKQFTQKAANHHSKPDGTEPHIQCKRRIIFTPISRAMTWSCTTFRADPNKHNPQSAAGCLLTGVFHNKSHVTYSRMTLGWDSSPGTWSDSKCVDGDPERSRSVYDPLSWGWQHVQPQYPPQETTSATMHIYVQSCRLVLLLLLNTSANEWGHVRRTFHGKLELETSWEKVDTLAYGFEMKMAVQFRQSEASELKWALWWEQLETGLAASELEWDSVTLVQ